ncbi:phosphoenolpyruvate phosphomutase family protein [Collimonas arenae]|uniref:Phosphoenolpyruvate phosphomutase family protein n=1 Tax=Collimonas arenae TaxID=279058 RepID=A0A127PWW8_9BURK|nr:isocitrate lyase/phosphoenolpyruvate mutase family protein [Collimonas arenae]AMP02303.1 phosphoenolpyruvate phosphomutase family protein [Collimonas arenae]AMP12197.1 phosphoenolpyruvate phosphomutase family protein [Collimonas arenae]
MQPRFDLAQQFRHLNLQGNFLLANAWDIAGARIFEETGFAAIGTTSGGIAYSHGYCDAELIDRDDMLRHIAAIAGAVNVPVTADIEAGYGASAPAVADTILRVIEAGAVGINIEDNSHGTMPSPLFDIPEQSARIRAAREAADQADLPLWINARIDTYLLGLGDETESRLAMTVARANAYLAAGADMVFVPALTDISLVKRLRALLHGPLNLMAMPGAPSAAELFAAGANRVSLGVCPMLAAMGTIREIAIEARSRGTWQTMQRSFYGFAEAEALFSARGN